MAASNKNLSSVSPDTSNPVLSAELSPRDARILDFERAWWQFGVSKEDAIREEFGLNPTQYYQQLNVLLDDPAALAYSPMLVKRLRRLRQQRQRGRAQRHLHRAGFPSTHSVQG